MREHFALAWHLFTTLLWTAVEHLREHKRIKGEMQQFSIILAPGSERSNRATIRVE